MFGVAALSIVLTLAVGPNATLLCRTWCDHKAAAVSGCHHETPGTSPSVAGDDTCKNVLSAAAFLREDVRGGAPSHSAAQADLVPRYQLARLVSDARPGHEPGREWLLEKRPLPTVLRI